MPTNGSCLKFKNLLRTNSSQESMKLGKLFDSWVPDFLAIFFKDLRNLFNRVPIARSGRNAEELLDFGEVSDCFHLSSIKAQHESVLNRNDFEQPVVI